MIIQIVVKIELHAKFKLNGNSYTAEELKAIAYDLVKEGLPHEKEIGNFLSYWFDDKRTIAVKTSGSTGKPKIISLQKKHMVNSAMATGKYFKLVAGYSALLCLPVEFIAGKMMLVRAMVLGLELDYMPATSNPLENSTRVYDFTAMVPLQADNSLDKIENIKTLIIGGAQLSIDLKQKLQEKSTSVFETYGMTETITHVAVKNILGSEYFDAVSNVHFSIDERDCLIIDALDIAKNTVVTNDVVRLLSSTTFEWLGRYDNVINSGGVKLHPEVIEKKLASNIDQRFFVAGIPDAQLGQKLVVIIEGEIDKTTVLEKLRKVESLGRFEVPKTVFSIREFKETATGKIQRNENLQLIQ